MFMMSSGGLTAAELFRGKDAILSGPAAGVVGMAETGRSAGFPNLIGFDMGGTSTDVSHFDGEYERAFETEVAGVRMRAPMMLIHTVAAGGGSILHFDGARFRVGPGSGRRQSRAEMLPPRRAARRHRRQRHGRQADPGFLPEDFRARAGPAARCRRPCAPPSRRLAKEIGDGRTPEQVADGFIRIAVENMANAIKKISVQRGYDVTRYALNCFGGAGGQHACLVADALGMTTVLIHPLLVAALGLRHGTRRHPRHAAAGDRAAVRARRRLASSNKMRRHDCRRTSAREVAGQGVPAKGIKVFVRAHIRYAGTDTALVVGGRLARRHESRIREGAQSALRLHRPRQGACHRSGVGRGGRRRRAISPSRSRKTTRAQAPLARLAARDSSPAASGAAPSSSPASSSRRAKR